MTKAKGLTAVILISVMSACASMNYKKDCNGDLCKITENGKVHYEGPPEKVAALQNQDKKKETEYQAMLEDFKKAPRRGGAEKIRVAVLGVEIDAEGISPANANTYHEQLIAALRRMPDIEIVSADLAQRALQGGSDRQESHFSGMGNHQEAGIDLKQDSTRAFRVLRVQSDFIIHPGIRFTSKTGLVSQKGGGTGIVQAEYVEFNAKGTSTFRHELQSWTSPGKYLKSLAAAGFDKNSKYKKGQMQLNVPIEKETDAIAALANSIHATLVAKVRPELPSLAAIHEIEAKRSVSSDGTAAPDPNSLGGKLQNLFKRK